MESQFYCFETQNKEEKNEDKLLYIYNKVKSIVTADLKSAVSPCCHSFILLCLSIILTLTSCGAENSISRRYYCHFVFKPQLHPGTDIETALNNQGSYTFVSAKKVNGAWHIYTTLNDGKNTLKEITLSTKTENYADYSNLGAGNDTKDATKNGFILGMTNFNGHVAWDRQCPNCITQYSSTNFPLQWTGSDRQSVKCAKCNRTYALETGAITEGNKGDALMRYNVSYSGIGSILTVGN